MNCNNCGAGSVVPVVVTLDLMGIHAEGMVYCGQCGRVAPTLQDSILMMSRKLKMYKSVCKFCYHYMNQLGKGCFATKIVMPGHNPDAKFDIDHSEDPVCENFKVDCPGKHCMLCMTQKPHHHADAIVGHIEAILEGFEDMAKVYKIPYKRCECVGTEECTCGDGSEILSEES